MACNCKRSLDSASKSLLKTSSSLKTLWYECNTPWILLLVHVWIIAIASAIIVVASLKKNQKNQNEIVDLPLATCRCYTSVMHSDTANSLVTDDNTGEWQVWLIKAYDYI